MSVFDTVLKKMLPNYKTADGSHTDVSRIKDIEGSVTNYWSGFSTPGVTFFDGADAGFGAAERFLRWPMDQWSECSFVFSNVATGMTLTLAVWLIAGGIVATGLTAIQIASIAVPNNTTIAASPNGGGSGASANYYAIPALASACKYLVLGILPASDPSAGYIRLYADRK